MTHTKVTQGKKLKEKSHTTHKRYTRAKSVGDVWRGYLNLEHKYLQIYILVITAHLSFKLFKSRKKENISKFLKLCEFPWVFGVYNLLEFILTAI